MEKIAGEINFEEILNELPVMVYVNHFYPEGHPKYPVETTYSNKRYTEILGFEAGKVLGKLEFATQSIHPEDFDIVKDAISLLHQNKHDESEARFRMLDTAGEEHFIISKVKVVERDSSGFALKAVGVNIDLTRYEQEQDLLKKMSESYTKLNKHIHLLGKLSKKEYLVLQYIAGNKTYEEIADSLFISKETVKTHIKRIRGKLNLKRNESLYKKTIDFGLADGVSAAKIY